MEETGSHVLSEFCLNAESLQAAMAACIPFASRWPLWPIMSNMLLRVDSDGVYLSATDRDDSIRVQVAGTGVGALCLPPSARDMLPQDGTVYLQADGAQVRVGALTFKGFDPSGYPALPVVPEEGQWVQTDELLRILPRAATCANRRDKGRPLLTAVHAIPGGEVLATDGYRIYVHNPTDTGRVLGALDVKIPASSIAKLTKPTVRRRLPAELRLAKATHAQVCAAGDGVTVWLRSLEGRYPKVLSMLPAKYPVSFRVDVAALREALKRLLPVVGGHPYSVQVDVGADALRLSASSSEGKGEEDVPISDAHGEGLRIAFDALAFHDGLRRLAPKKGAVLVEFSGATTIARFHVSDDSTYYQMPLAID